MDNDRLKAEVNAAYLAYYGAFIANDLAGINAVVCYPFALIGQAGVRLCDAFPFDPAELKRTKQCHTTINVEHEVVAVSERNAHVILRRADRIRRDGSLIETVSGFYAFTRTSAGWKMFAMSAVANPAQ